jgi:hypothetical protein
MKQDPFISNLALSHGQVMYVIEAMHIAEWLDRPALDSVLKKFRRALVPFSADELDKPHWDEHRFLYVHLVECVVAMKMVADGLSFRHVVSLLTYDREKLRAQYLRAFGEATLGEGTEIEISTPDGRLMRVGGLYLDFMATINRDGVLSTTGPRLLSPWEALNRYMGVYLGLHPSMPIRLSQLVTEAVRIAQSAPVYKRGRKAGNKILRF